MNILDWMVDDCDQGFAGEWGNPLDGLVQLQVGGVHLGVLLESVTKSLLLLLLQGKYQLKYMSQHTLYFLKHT